MAYSVCHAPLQITNEMLPEIHRLTMEKVDFVKSIINLVVCSDIYTPNDIFISVFAEMV